MSVGIHTIAGVLRLGQGPSAAQGPQCDYCAAAPSKLVIEVETRTNPINLCEPCATTIVDREFAPDDITA